MSHVRGVAFYTRPIRAKPAFCPTLLGPVWAGMVYLRLFLPPFSPPPTPPHSLSIAPASRSTIPGIGVDPRILNGEESAFVRTFESARFREYWLQVRIRAR